MSSSPRSVPHVLGTGALAGLFAGLAAGLIDALWSWAPAAQFVPAFLSRVRFVVYSGLVLAATGALAGFLAAAVLGHVSRRTRLGDLVRFGWSEHARLQAKDPRDTLIGLSLVIAGVPLLGLAIYVVYKVMTPIVVKSHAMGLAVLSVVAATIAALIAVVIGMFVIGRLVELLLREVVRSVPVLAEPITPIVVGLALIAIELAWLAHAQWATAKILPLRGPLIAVVGALLAVPAYRPASHACDFIGMFRPAIRRTVWVVWPVVLAVLVLWAGGSAPVVKASTMYTGLGAPIARGVRKTFDRDRDGYSRFLGGGDCDDSAPTVHPGAAEIPDDGIDQNCVGGDASLKATHEDVAFAPVPPAVPKDLNVLLITIDTTRADHLGMYGYQRPTSPNMDAVAAQGTVFDAGWAHAPSTRYSMPAILTGRLPLDVFYDTSVSGWPGLSLKATTLAEYLTSLGYISGAITNFWYFDRERHMDQGFVEYDNEDARLHGGVAGAGPERSKGSSSKEQTDKAIAFVDKHAAEKWFLWVHYYDPHADYEPHAEVPPFGSDAVALYDGEIRFTDLHLGRLFEDLKAKGLYDRTVIVITGDHGEGFGEHRIDHHGYHLYSAQTKVPLVIRVPGMPARHAKTPAGHVDIAPTLVNLAGGQPGPDMMGRSLVDVLSGADKPRTVFQQLSFENNNEKRAAVDGRCHVIYNVSPDTSWEAYRVDRDPLEAHDLASSEECADTRHALERWYDAEQVPAGAAEALLPSGAGLAAPLDTTFQGARLMSVDAPKTAHPGETLTLTWTFQATGRTSSDWKIFAHLKGPANAFINGDHKPVRPFEWWKPGQFIRYTTTLALPRILPSGPYTLWVGLFRGNQRAPATTTVAKLDNNAVLAATIEISP